MEASTFPTSRSVPVNNKLPSGTAVGICAIVIHLAVPSKAAVDVGRIGRRVDVDLDFDLTIEEITLTGLESRSRNAFRKKRQLRSVCHVRRKINLSRRLGSRQNHEINVRIILGLLGDRYGRRQADAHRVGAALGGRGGSQRVGEGQRAITAEVRFAGSQRELLDDSLFDVAVGRQYQPHANQRGYRRKGEANVTLFLDVGVFHRHKCGRTNLVASELARLRGRNAQQHGTAPIRGRGVRFGVVGVERIGVIG